MATRLEVEHAILEKLIEVCVNVDNAMMACIEGRGDTFYGSRDPIIQGLVKACGDAQRHYIWARMSLRKLDEQEAEFLARRKNLADEYQRQIVDRLPGDHELTLAFLREPIARWEDEGGSCREN